MRTLALTVSILFCAAVAAYAETPAASTKVVNYSPVGLKATKAVKGSCWTNSIASNRSDAYRCMVDNEIYDPCFVIDPSSVGCPTDISASTGVVIDLQKKLPPAASPATHPQVWAMLLKSGARCDRATGTVVADYPFYCSGEKGVCQGPDLSQSRSAYFVKCGNPADAMHVKNVTSTLVTTAYQ